MPEQLRVGDRVQHLKLEEAWLVDPATGREGSGSLVVEGGRIASVEWTPAGTAAKEPPPVMVVPALVDLHVHFREPGFEDAETIATGAAAAAHGGFGTVCLMANTNPPIDSAAALEGVLQRGRATGIPLRIHSYGTATLGRAGETLAPMAELASAGAVGFSDDGSPVADASLFRNALAYAGALHRPLIEHAEQTSLTKGAEAHEGLVATILGLKGWPAAAEESAVARALAILDEVNRAAPSDGRPHLHLAHISTAGAVELVRRAKAAGLPVTCEATPHHLALHDGWVAGDRRFAWEAAGSPWAGGPVERAAFDTSTRVNPPLRTPADALALWAGLADGTIDAIATDHAPHRRVDKLVEFGDALNGISGLETALLMVLAGVAAGLLPLAAAVRALTVSPGRLLAAWSGRPAGSTVPGLVEDAPASLVVVDRGDSWGVSGETLRSKGTNTPLLGRALAGRVLATIVDGRVAHLDGEL